MIVRLFPFLIVLVLGCKSPEPRRPITKTSGHFIKESMKRHKKLQKRQEKHIKKIIARDSTHRYHTSSNGFWYRYDHKNTTDEPTPKIGDVVTFRYNIKTLNGKTIYSRKEIGTRIYKIDKESVFSGLRHGLKLMKEGETATFLFPSYTAFGYYGDNKKIGHNVPIRSTIILNKIQSEHDSINVKSTKSQLYENP